MDKDTREDFPVLAPFTNVSNVKVGVQGNREIQTSVLSAISGDLFREIRKICQENGNLTDSALLALHSVYGNVLERALELMEKNCVTFLRIPDGSRYVVQVSGSSGMLYTLLPHINYCPCPAYRYQVVGTRTDVTCKHVLAAQLTEATGGGRSRQLTPKELTEALLHFSGLNES